MVVGRATNLGEPTWCATDFWPLNTTLYVADFKDNVPRWVFHLFESIDLKGYDSGSVQPMLNRNYIAGVEVLVPPLAEQRAIAEVLGALDDKIAANTRLATTADALAIALASTAPASVPLASLAEHARRSVAPESTGATLVDHYSLPAFDAAQGPERVDPSTIKSNKFLVSTPAVLVSKLNPRFPRVWEVPQIGELPVLASTEFVVLEPKEITTAVLWALVAQPAFSATLAGMVAGTSGSHQRVRPAEMLMTLVGDPTELAAEVQSGVTAAVRRAGAARAENIQLAATRDALLPALMSGRMRVRDAEAVVADAT
ncbi:hypothetical protein N869_13015 [Cellulomonas bogoriensis 69B4 = DSM 16987]|uniref:Type I restriction modification DNA specificity domain-containing protein n=2 Tax=Cellulomonas bogoriensis TaxID=301388 RepID=A0A0A0C050_9CELL|nr:hypothetical protein N869_13015 [Cellulomonas bogoriensis 69B4 = DSM 16987]